jgi:toxin HigB-1
VHIEFATNRLADAGISLAESSRLFGVPIGRKYIQRLAVLRATDKFTQLFGYWVLKLYFLKGKRAGRHALTLTGNYRLIIKKVEEDRVRIMDVEDYHGD